MGIHGSRHLSSPRAAGSAARDHDAAISRRMSPELCLVSTPSDVRGRREDRVPAGHPRSTVRRLRYERLHSGIQVKPNIRPSLRSGLTAYAGLSPGSDALLPPSPCGCRCTRPVGRHTSPQRLTPACGRQDHTVLPYADRTGRVRNGLRSRLPALRCLSRRCRLRPPQPTPRFVTIAIRPSDRGEVRHEYAKAEFR